MGLDAPASSPTKASVSFLARGGGRNPCWRRPEAVFNDTKQNVAASSEYELSYLGGDRGDLGEGGGADKRLSEGSAAELKPAAREGKALEWSRVSTCSEHVASLPGWSNNYQALG